MPQACKLMIVEQSGARAPLRERLLDHYQRVFRSQRVTGEAELRAVAREYAPDIVLGTDDLPTSPDAECVLIRLLSRHAPELLICELDDGSTVRWEPQAASRHAAAARLERANRYTTRYGSFAPSEDLSAFFEGSMDAAVIVDSEGWIGFANASACTLLSRYFPEPLGTYLAGGPARSRGLREDGAPAANVIKLPLRQPGPVQGLVVLEQSTQVATRVHLEDLVRAKTSRASRHGGCLPLVALELNGLQLLNERYGRSVCDEMFSIITSAVQPRYARCGLIASLGKGEHLVVLPHVSDASDAAVAVQERPARADDYAMVNRINLFEEPPDSEPPVLRHAVRMQRRAAPRVRLRNAIQRRAINVHYQPQYDADTGEGSGVEALARWTMSNGETLMPGAFLPIAERIGVIGRLGAVVLEDACAMAAGWRGRDGERLTLAVNVSTSQITDAYTQTLTDTLKHSGLPARRLELEVEESALIGAADVVLERIREWRRLGVRIAVNHHGSNYSTLGYLSQLQVDRLKLDRLLVQRMAEHRGVAGFVHAVVSLGREFDVDVMAQGVETTAQLNLLRAMGCRHVQGFLLARPMPAMQAQLALRRSFGNLPQTALAATAPMARAH